MKGKGTSMPFFPDKNDSVKFGRWIFALGVDYILIPPNLISWEHKAFLKYVRYLVDT